LNNKMCGLAFDTRRLRA